MANVWAHTLDNGSNLFVMDAMPSQAGDGQFTAGDFLFIIASAQSGIYRCTATGNGSTAAFAMAATTGSVANGLTALAGGGQAGATPLTADSNRVTTVATAADSVLLPPAVVGRLIFVANAGANSMNVFPSTGDAINLGAANAAFAVGSAKSAQFWCTVAGKWNALLSA